MNYSGELNPLESCVLSGDGTGVTCSQVEGVGVEGAFGSAGYAPSEDFCPDLGGVIASRPFSTFFLAFSKCILYS